MVLVGNLIIKPGQTVVTVAKLGAGAKEVERGCRQIQDRVAPRRWPKAFARSVASCRNLAGRELAGEPSKDVAGSQAHRDVVGLQQGASLSHPSSRRIGGDAREAKHKVLLLVGGKNEQVVINDRAACRKSVVFVALSRRLSSGRRNKEGRMIGEELIPVVVI